VGVVVESSRINVSSDVLAKARLAKAALSITLKRHCLPNDFPPPLFSLINHRLRKTLQRSEILPPHRAISGLVAGLVVCLFLRAEFLSSGPQPVGPKSSKSVCCKNLNCIRRVQRYEHTGYRQARARCQGLLAQRVLTSVKAHKPYIILICHVNWWTSRSRFKSLLLLFCVDDRASRRFGASAALVAGVCCSQNRCITVCTTQISTY
jgi:hypothetical protein